MGTGTILLIILTNRPAANALVATVRMVADARGLALGVLAALALVFALSWAQTFLVPLLLGIVIAYTLNPLVSWKRSRFRASRGPSSSWRA